MNAEKLKHTPGPWQLKGLNPPRIYADEGKEIICQCNSMGEMTQSQEKANARLIAAAPQMLDALEIAELILHPGVIGLIGNYHGARAVINASDAVYAIRAAIAKAKGEA